MANRRFIDFPIATTVGDSDIILIWQSGVNKQTTKATFLSGLPENLDELNDVAISGLTNGQILRYDSVTGKWENTDQGNLDLNDLNDVSIVSPSNGQVLVYNSSTSKWENSSGGFVPYTGAVTTVNLGAQTIQAGQFVKAGGTSSQFLKADGSIDSTAYGTGSVTSVGLTMPSAFNVANSPVTTAGTLAVTGAGTVAQYIRGDGSLADFPEASGGGSSISYYLNGSVNQGTIGGVAYKELNKVPILGAGTDFTINADGYIVSFITDAGDPNLLEIPGGNWNFETYFSASSGGGSPTFYVELYKVNSGGTATLIASNSSAPELIAFGTNITAYFSSLAVPTTTLALTDRLAVRYYVTHSGRTITMHTENNHLCQIITTFTTGLTALNGLTAQVQNFATGTTGTDFNIASATATHTFNLPTASATNRGALSSADWTTFNNKQNALTNPVTGTGAAGRVAYWNGSGTITSDSLFQWNDFSKRLGIGRTPTVSLDVEGAGFFSGTVTASSIIKSGGTSSQYLMADGSVSTLTNPVTGTGTTNYLPKFTGASTIGNSQVFDNGTGVGIGINSPSNKLDVLGSAASPNLVGTNAYARFYQSGGYANVTIGALASGSFAGWIQTSDGVGTALPLSLQPSGGNLLVGTTTDNGARLQVSGTSTFSDIATFNNGTNSTNGIKVVSTLSSSLFTGGIEFIRTTVAGGSKVQPLRDAAIGGVGLNFLVTANNTAEVNATYTSAMTILNNGNVGIGTASPIERLHVETSNEYQITWARTGAGKRWAIGTDTAGFYFNNRTDSVLPLYITNGGNVGIGTASPGQLLHLYTNLATSSGVGTALQITSDGAGGDNAWIGVNKGTGNGLEFSVENRDIIFNTGATTPFGGSERMRITSGGNVLIGTATSGASKLRIVGLPTSSAGLSSGDVYSDSGTLKIA